MNWQSLELVKILGLVILAIGLHQIWPRLAIARLRAWVGENDENSSSVI